MFFSNVLLVLLIRPGWDLACSARSRYDFWIQVCTLETSNSMSATHAVC
jgi:hypothetical protein